MTKQKIDYNLSKKSIFFLREVREKLNLSFMGTFDTNSDDFKLHAFLTTKEKRTALKDCKRLYRKLIYDLETYCDEYHGVPHDEWVITSQYLSEYIKKFLVPFIVNYSGLNPQEKSYPGWLDEYIKLSDATREVCEHINQILRKDNENKIQKEEQETILDLKNQLQDKEEDIIFFKKRIEELKSAEGCISQLEKLGLSDAVCRYIVVQAISADPDIDDKAREFMDERNLNYKSYLLKALQYFPDEVNKQ